MANPPLKRITRDRYLTPEEVSNYRKIREQIEQELPELIARHHQRMLRRSISPAHVSALESLLGDAELLSVEFPEQHRLLTELIEILQGVSTVNRDDAQAWLSETARSIANGPTLAPDAPRFADEDYIDWIREHGSEVQQHELEHHYLPLLRDYEEK